MKRNLSPLNSQSIRQYSDRKRPRLLWRSAVLAGVMVVSVLFGRIASATPADSTPQPTAALAQVEGPRSAPTATITGDVFRDYNADGVQNGNEAALTGVGGITVTAFDDSNSDVGSTTVISTTGSFSLTATGSGPFRIEFSGLPEWLDSTASGTNNGTMVQFISDGGTADLGVMNSADYCQSNPSISTTCYENGTGLSNTGPGLISFAYDSDGIPTGYAGGAGSETPPQKDADINELGSVWGAAYQTDQERLYLASFLKRHSGFINNPGHVYIFDYGTSGVPSLGSFDLSGTTPDSGPAIDLGSVCRRSLTDGDPNNTCDPFTTGNGSDYTLPTSTSNPNIDLDAFGKVGTISFGDIDLTEDQKTLWLVNLNQRSLIDVDVSSTTASQLGTINHTLLGSLAVARSDNSSSTFDGICSATGVMRPWALNFQDGVGYLGAVCDASITENTADLTAHVLTFDPSNLAAGLSELFTVAMDYEREPGDQLAPDGVWQFWADDWAEANAYTASDDDNYMAPQPILSDIEVTEDGSLVLAIMDRFGHQFGRKNREPLPGNSATQDANSMGDMLHVCRIGSSFVLEGSPGCTVSDTAGTGIGRTDDGPSGTGEYYFEDYYFFTNTIQHSETAIGSLALLRGSNAVVAPHYDPIPSQGPFSSINLYATQGVVWHNTQTGTRALANNNTEHSYLIIDQNNTVDGFGKGAGLGDLELICQAAPTEIGSYIWADNDGDGIQDPGENGLPDISVTLYSITGTVVGATTTNADGEYYLNDTNVNQNGAAGIQPNTAYNLCVPLNDADLDGRSITTKDYAGNANHPTSGTSTDVHDSDGDNGTILADHSCVQITTGNAGDNDHTRGFGFISSVNIGDRVWTETDGDGIYGNDASDAAVVGTTVTAVDATGNSYTAQTDANGLYTITVPANATYTVTLSTPAGFEPSTIVVPGADNDPSADNDRSHNPSGAVVTVTDADNLTIDFAFTPQEMCFDPTDLGGDIFRDFDHDGVNDTASGPDGAFYDVNNPITVYAYDNDNAVVGTAIVRADGTYLFDDIFSSNTHIRLEFTGLPSYLEAGYSGTDQGTPTQTHQAGTCGADLGVHNSADYCESNPLVATACYVDGDQSTTDDVLVALNYDASGAVQHIAVANQIGSTWGIAYQRTTQTIFSSAVLKRHTGFGPGQDGITGTADDISAIYVLDYSNPGANGEGTVNTGRTIDLSDLGIDVGADPRLTSTPANDLNPAGDESRDYDVHDNIGRLGIGGIHLSDDGQTLYLVNLNTVQPQLVALNVSDLDNITLASAVNIPNPGCPGSDTYAPWGVHVRDGNVYVGTVCTADNSANAVNLRAYVQQLSSSTFINVDLDSTTANDYIQLYYDRGCRFFFTPDGRCLASEWREWNSSWNVHNQTGPAVHTAQPILSDLAFGTDGSLTLGLMDRTGHQRGYQNLQPDTGDSTLYNYIAGGDLLKLCLVNGAFIPEGGAGCAQSFSNVYDKSTVNDLAPGAVGIPDEFYNDNTVATGVNDQHGESFFGGFAQMPTTDQLVATYLDPAGGYTNGGYRWHDQSDGSHFRNYELYTTAVPANDPNTFSKANGLGDVALLCAAAPLEIGNYVWQDDDGDGVQDPCEMPINGVKVDLYQDPDGIAGNGDETFIGSTYTSDSGEYYFDAEPNTNYYISIDPADPALDGLMITTQDYAGDANHPTSGSSSDAHDSDGAYNANTASVITSLTTGAAGENDYTFDFGFKPAEEAALGNYVWLDEDSDGVQDAGERGIPNVTVTLTPPAGIDLGNGEGVAITTTTDANGGYLFDSLPPADGYVVTIDGTQPALDGEGLSYTVANSSGNNSPDFGNQNPAGYTVDLSADEVDLSADFGYNYNPNDDVNNGSGVAALGDTIWIDSDGDGVEDPDEVGVQGVTVTLYHDPDGNGVYDTVYGTTATDANGNYLFDNLPAGAYSARVTGSDAASHDVLGADYTQTGDPDDFGNPATSPDSYGDPVVLDPGDVFLNLDFGYRPNAGAALNSVGDTVWYDADADGNGMSQAPVDGGAAVTQGAGGTADATDYGIAGVSVSLIKDSNGNGVYDAGEPIIATDVTDGNGQYLFEDLADGAYIVMVNDSDGVLNGLNQSYDDNGALDNMSAVDLDSAGSNAASVDDRDQDFGYSNSTPNGSIGDTVWFDVDSSAGNQATQGAESGLGGVTVNLFADDNGDGIADSSTPIATTTTDSNGTYLFDGLPLKSYVVSVDTTTLPAGVGTTSTYESDGDTDNTSATVTLSDTAPHNRDQDFSYPPANSDLGSIGDTIFGDVDSTESDGVPDAADVPLAGVTVLLTDSSGNVTSTVTNGAGQYLFANLPAGAYTVTVDTGTLPVGFSTTPTYDPDGGTDNTSSLTLGTGEHNRAQDFSYPPTGTDYSIGDKVWFDVNSSGGDEATQGSEPGLAGVRVNLYDGSGSLIDSTTTASDGSYLFTGLPTDTYRVAVDTTTLPPYVSSTSTHDGSDGGTNSSSTILVNAANPHERAQDFSYPPATTPQEGLIGDTIYHDLDRDGVQDADEVGIAGVVVVLTDANGVTTTTTTDSSGRYAFPGLALNETYTVTVPLGSLSSNRDLLIAFAVTGDPDATLDGVSTTTLTPAAPIDLEQDFGVATRLAFFTATIGNLVWFDSNADGVYDADGADNILGTDDDEPLIDGVTIDLYRDLNGNGLLDSGEPLFATTVTSDTLVTTSGDGGNYLFANLPPEGSGANGGVDFIVHVSDRDGVLNGYWHSMGAANTTDNSQMQTYAVNVNEGNRENLTADFGYYVEAAALGNYVWIDSDADGQQDDGETGLNGVEVDLMITYDDGTMITVTTVTTDDISGNPGWYSFDNLLLDEDYAAGNGAGTAGATQPAYTIKVDMEQPVLAAYLPTVIDAGGDDKLDSDDPAGVTAVPTQGLTDVEADDPAINEQSIASYDFGVILPVRLGGLLWEDVNNDELADATDTHNTFATVQVNLYSITGTLVATTTADATGEYLFEGLQQGAYQVRIPDTAANVAAFAGYASSTGADSIDGQVDPNNGTDNDDNGYADSDSGFLFSSLPVTLTASMTLTETDGIDAGDDEAQANAANPATAAYADAASNLTVDFGFVPPVKIGDRLWIEDDNDGVYGTGNAIPVTNTVVTAVDGAGNSYTATTDANGLYTITVPANATYTVTVGTPDGTTPSGTLIDSSSDPSDTNDLSHDGTGTVVTVGTEDNLTIDFGFFQPAELGDFVWNDLNYDGIQDNGEPGIGGVTVELLDGNGNPITDTVSGLPITATTTITGYYQFTDLVGGTYQVRFSDLPAQYEWTLNNVESGAEGDAGDNDAVPDGGSSTDASATTDDIVLSLGDSNQTIDAGAFLPPPGSLGNFVWNDLDRDGIQDDNEPGMAGVTVTLYFANGDPVTTDWNGQPYTNTTTTDGNGGYSFIDLADGPDGTAYYVVVTLPDGYEFTVQDNETGPAGDDDDSDVNPTGPQIGQSSVVTISQVLVGGSPAGENNPTLDAGMFYRGSIGNRVWIDADDSGTLNGSEAGINNVVVNLLDSSGNPVTDTVTGAVLTATTTAGGYYLFDDLPEGKYIVEVDASNFAAGGVLENHGSSSGVEADADANADATDGTAPSEDNGIDDADPATNGIRSGVLMLSGSSEPSETDLGPEGHGAAAGDGRSNLTLDFGFVPPVEIGNRVWVEDDNNGDATDGFVRPVTDTVVTAVGSNGQTYTATTDANGFYTLTVPANVTYTVGVDTPAGLTVAGTPLNDNSGTADNLSHNPAGTTVVVGTENDYTIDFGFYDAPLYAIGNYVWIDEGNADGIYDSGTENGVGGVRVELYQNGQLITFTTTTGSGAYLFDNLPAGDYSVVITSTNFISGGALFDSGMSTPLTPSPVYTDTALNDDVMVGSGNATAGVSASVTVGDAAEPSGEDEHGLPPTATDTNSDLTIDFGFFVPDQTAVGLGTSAATVTTSATPLLVRLAMTLTGISGIAVRRRRQRR